MYQTVYKILWTKTFVSSYAYYPQQEYMYRETKEDTKE